MATKASATADSKLSTTLDQIQAIEASEKRAAVDAYAKLVADAANERIELTASQVVAVLRRANRTADDLRSDAALERELQAAETEASTFVDRVEAVTEARNRVGAAEVKYAEACEAARQPVIAAKNALDGAQGLELAARQATQRVVHLKAERAKREAARQGVKPNDAE